MYRYSSYLIALALLWGLTVPAVAQDWDIEIPSTNTPPVIDGEIDSVPPNPR